MKEHCRFDDYLRKDDLATILISDTATSLGEEGQIPHERDALLNLSPCSVQALSFSCLSVHEPFSEIIKCASNAVQRIYNLVDKVCQQREVEILPLVDREVGIVTSG